MKLKNQTKIIIAISFLISICLIVFIAINADRYIKNMSKNNSELYDAYRISELMKSFRSNITVLENKERGYVVTGDAKFLEEYKISETEIKTHLQRMEKYFVEKPEEALFFQLKDLTYEKIMQAKDLSHNMPGIPQMGEENTENSGLTLMAEINSTVDLINASLSKTTQSLINNSIAYVQSSKKWGLLEVAIGILAMIGAIIILFRDINVRNRLETELRIAKKQADDNAMMKEQFMANMSHEIRTPMNAILGFSDLLYKTDLDSTQAEYLSAIKHSGSNLLNIINDILDFSKIEAGMLHIEHISFNIQELIRSLKIIFEEKAKEKNITFTVITDERLPVSVFGDPTRLTQILVNLLNNAVKFTQHGTVSLTIEIKEMNNNVVDISFKVKDTGIGIPADKQSGVFERFNQGNSKTTRMYGGTGLGLSIVKSLVEMQKGYIHFTSVENKGTEFIVTISYSVSHKTITGKNEAAQTSLNELQGRSLNILLAEDNILNQKLATTLLRGFGLHVEVADNGQTVLEMLKDMHFDMVLMDIQMPVLDGYHTAMKIRNELQLQLPIIAMTAHIMEGEKEKCISYGMNDYISKPFKEAELYDVVVKQFGTITTPKTTASINVQSESKIINLDRLYEMANGSNQFIKEMIEIFIEQNPVDLKEIATAIAINDFETIEAVSHRMKSSVGFIGLDYLLVTLTNIENSGSSASGIDDIKKEFEKVKKSSETAIQELKLVLEKLV